MKELKLITQSLYKFEQWLYGVNYECHFKFERINESLNIQEACERINEIYNLSSAKSSVQAVDYEDFLNDISEKLRYRGDKGAGVNLSPTQEGEFENELKKLRELIKQAFKPSNTSIYIHPEITTSIFWGFCFLLVSRKYKAIYLLEGFSSD